MCKHRFTVVVKSLLNFTRYESLLMFPCAKPFRYYVQLKLLLYNVYFSSECWVILHLRLIRLSILICTYTCIYISSYLVTLSSKKSRCKTKHSPTHKILSPQINIYVYNFFWIDKCIWLHDYSYGFIHVHICILTNRYIHTWRKVYKDKCRST